MPPYAPVPVVRSRGPAQALRVDLPSSPGILAVGLGCKCGGSVLNVYSVKMMATRSPLLANFIHSNLSKFDKNSLDVGQIWAEFFVLGPMKFAKIYLHLVSIFLWQNVEVRECKVADILKNSKNIVEKY